MRGRTVHHVYAEDEQPQEPYDVQPTDSYDVQPTDSYDEHPTESHEYPRAPRLPRHAPAQPAWRFPRQSRALVMALLCAAVAFVAAFAIQALHGGPRAIVVGRGAVAGTGRTGTIASGRGLAAQSPHATTFQAAEGVPQRAHRRRARRHPQWAPGRTMRRGRLPSSALMGEARGEVPAVAHSSTARAAPVVVARAAGSEFNFER